jgi:L-asparaginase II
MLAFAVLLGTPLDGYLDLQHRVQVAIRDCLVDFLQLDPQSLTVGVDGCSAPAYALSLQQMARGFALLAAPDQIPERWRTPLDTIRQAMQAHPQLVGASVGRLDTALMTLGRGLVAKSGAEGGFAVGHPSGVGLAVKVMDGDTGSRARHPATVAAARHLGWLTDEELAGTLGPLSPSLPLLNAAGLQTGELRPAAALLQPAVAV